MALTKVSTPGIKDEAIILAKLLHGDSNSNGKFLRANNGADPTFETVNTDLVSDTSPQLGGNLDVNNKNILIGDSSGSTVNRLRIGAGPDLEIYHNGTDTAIQNYTGDLYINNTGGNADDIVIKAQDDIFLMPQNGEYGVSVLGDGAVELYYDNSKKLETTTNGIKIGSLLDINPSTYTEIQDNSAYGLNIKHMNSKPISIATGGDYIQIYNLTSSEMYIKCLKDAAVELYNNGSKKLETSSIGVNIFGDSTVGVSTSTHGNLHFISPSDNASARYSRIRKNYNSPFNMEYFASTSASAQNHVFYSNLTTERVRFQGGGGISFNGDTAAANALDDYEEGTFTALLQVQSGSPGFSTTTGRYTKIGRVVHVHAEIFWNAANGTGNANIYIPLPFNVTSAGRGGFAIGLVSGLDCDGGHFPTLLPEINAGYAWLLQFRGDDPAGGHSHMVASDMRNYASRAFSFGGTYTTD